MKSYLTDLEAIIVSGSCLLDNRIKNIIKIFLAAANDWPSPVLNLEDYELEIEKFIGGETKKDKIEAALINNDPLKNSWKIESLYQTTFIFGYYEDDISLKELINNLKKQLKELMAGQQ